MTPVLLPARFSQWVDVIVAQAQQLLRTFRQLLESTIASRRTLMFVAEGMRRRTEAVMPYAKLAVGTVGRLLGNFRPQDASSGYGGGWTSSLRNTSSGN
jgi:hypothetical protein